MIPMTGTGLSPVTTGGEIGGAGSPGAAGLDFLDAFLAALPPEARELTEQELADWLQGQDAGLEGLSVPEQAAALLGLIESSRQTLPAAGEMPAVGVAAALPDVAAADGTDVEIHADLAVPARTAVQPGAAAAQALSAGVAAQAGPEVEALAGTLTDPAAAALEAGEDDTPAAVVEQAFRSQLQAAASGEPEAVETQPRVPVRHPEFGQAVGERLLWMVRNGLQEAKIRLDPPHLGQLEISIAVKDDRADVLIQAAHALTREALDAELPRLRAMLAEAGFASVDVGIASDQRGQAAGEQQQEAGQHQAMAGAEDVEEAEPVTVRATRGLIDHYA